jgi:hypothetical protein
MVSHPIFAIAARTGIAPRIAPAELIGVGGARTIATGWPYRSLNKAVVRRLPV